MPKILFYCHNVLGLGHIVRSLCIAEHLVHHCQCTLMTGCRFLSSLDIDSRIQIHQLPSLRMVQGRFEDAQGQSRDIITTRSQMILDALRRCPPEAVVMDHLALGLGGELMPTLLAAQEEGWPTRFIWGLRDVIVSPERIGSRLRPPKNPQILKAMGRIDAAMLYTDAKWIDALDYYRDYPLPERITYVGPVTKPMHQVQVADDRPLLTALAGGGTGGRELFSALLHIIPDLPDDLWLRIVTGPFGDSNQLQEAGDQARIQIWNRGSVQEAIQGASLVVSRVGYNTAYALTQTPLPLVFVPLPANEGEQQYRAKNLAQLDRVWMVEETREDFYPTLTQTIRTGLQSRFQDRELPFTVNGGRNAADFVLDQARGRG